MSFDPDRFKREERTGYNLIAARYAERPLVRHQSPVAPECGGVVLILRAGRACGCEGRAITVAGGGERIWRGAGRRGRRAGRQLQFAAPSGMTLPAVTNTVRVG